MEELDGTEKKTLRIFQSITLIHEVGMVLLEVSAGMHERQVPSSNFFVFCFQWIANPLNDMYADAITTVVLEVQSNPKAQKGGL